MSCHYISLSSFCVNLVSIHSQFQLTGGGGSEQTSLFHWSTVHQIYLCSTPWFGTPVSCMLYNSNCDKPEHLLYAPKQCFTSTGTVSASLKLLKGLTYTAFQCTAMKNYCPQGDRIESTTSNTESLCSFDTPRASYNRLNPLGKKSHDGVTNTFSVFELGDHSLFQLLYCYSLNR